MWSSPKTQNIALPSRKRAMSILKSKDFASQSRNECLPELFLESMSRWTSLNRTPKELNFRLPTKTLATTMCYSLMSKESKWTFLMSPTSWRLMSSLLQSKDSRSHWSQHPTLKIVRFSFRYITELRGSNTTSFTPTRRRKPWAPPRCQ